MHLKILSYLCIRKRNNNKLNPKTRKGREIMKTTANNNETKKMTLVNEEVIIASDQAMIDVGLIKCNPREGQLTLWAYMLNHVWNEWQWAPIMRVFDKPLTEDLTDEDGIVIEPKSTHKIAGFYGALIHGDLDMSRFLANRNVPVEKL